GRRGRSAGAPGGQPVRVVSRERFTITHTGRGGVFRGPDAPASRIGLYDSPDALAQAVREGAPSVVEAQHALDRASLALHEELLLLEGQDAMIAELAELTDEELLGDG